MWPPPSTTGPFYVLGTSHGAALGGRCGMSLKLASTYFERATLARTVMCEADDPETAHEAERMFTGYLFAALGELIPAVGSLMPEAADVTTGLLDRAAVKRQEELTPLRH
jgi:hypothetical protein